MEGIAPEICKPQRPAFPLRHATEQTVLAGVRFDLKVIEALLCSEMARWG
jgi:hypothetical protein